MKNKILIKIFAVSALLLSAAVQAVIIDNGDYTTVNGLDWLDLSITNTMTQAQIDSDPSLVGWSYATDAQYDALIFEFFGLSTNQQLVNSTPADANALPFIQLFGTTLVYSNTGFSHGWLYGNGFRQIGGVAVSFDGSRSQISTNSLYNYNGVNFDGISGVGTFLVRNTEIPIPAPLWLIGLGLLGFGLKSKRV